MLSDICELADAGIVLCESAKLYSAMRQDSQNSLRGGAAKVFEEINHKLKNGYSLQERERSLSRIGIVTLVSVVEGLVNLKISQLELDKKEIKNLVNDKPKKKPPGPHCIFKINYLIQMGAASMDNDDLSSLEKVIEIRNRITHYVPYVFDLNFDENGEVIGDDSVDFLDEKKVRIDLPVDYLGALPHLRNLEKFINYFSFDDHEFGRMSERLNAVLK